MPARMLPRLACDATGFYGLHEFGLDFPVRVKQRMADKVAELALANAEALVTLLGFHNEHAVNTVVPYGAAYHSIVFAD